MKSYVLVLIVFLVWSLYPCYPAATEEKQLQQTQHRKAGALFQSAYRSFQGRQYHEAIRAFRQLSKEFPDNILIDYAVVYTAMGLVNTADYENARKTLEHFRTAYPQSLLLEEAKFLEADTYYYQQQYDHAIRHYLALKQNKRYKAHPLMPGLYLKLGQSYEQQKHFNSALQVYHQARFSFLSSPVYALVKEREEQLLHQHPSLQTHIPLKQQLQDAKKLVNSGKANDAIPIVMNLLTHKLAVSQKEQAILTLAHAHYVLRENQRALEYYTQALKDYPKSKSIPAIFDRMARLHLRQQNMKAFLKVYESLKAKYPKSSTTAEATRLKGKEFEEQEKFEDALRVYQTFMKAFPKHQRVPDILWHTGWSNYQLQRYQAALKAFSRLARAYPKSPLRDEALYWAGKSAEHLRQFSQAGKYYIQAINTKRNSYYGFLSQQTLITLQQNHPKLKLSQQQRQLKALVFDDDAEFSSKHGRLHWKKAEAFKELGFYDLAAEELEYAIKKDTPTNAKYLELAQLYQQAGNYHQLYKLMRNRFSYWIIQGDERLAEIFWKLAYPSGFYDIVQSHASEYNIDPFFVLSIILAESAFNPDAYAPDGGTGLMQLMPETGAKLAHSLKISPPDPNTYFQPEVNILLGTTYLNQLLQLFDHQLPPVIASYNAGEEKVTTWWKEAYRENQPAFIASIPYPITKRHVQRVLWYYREYQRIYRIH